MDSLARSRFLALAAATAVTGAARPARAQDLKAVRVLGNPNDDSTSLYYALKAGLFAKAGLDVHIDTSTSGAAVAAAVIGGSYDIGKSSVTSIFQAHEKGIPFTLIAPASIQEPATPFAGTLVLKDAPIRTGKDLENQIVGVSSLSSIGRPAVCSWVESTGGDWRAVKFVEIPLTQAAAAVEQKRVVASETAQPMLATALAAGNLRTLPTYTTIAPRFVLTTWFTTKAWSAAHPDIAHAFARVMADSAAYTNAHHAETAPIMAAAGNVDVAVINGMQRVINGSVLQPALIQPAINVSARYGPLTAAFPAQEIIDAHAAT
jgi:ABC-type nitrate/sulfonate/bicarbonate transport system substrate-binding protein